MFDIFVITLGFLGILYLQHECYKQDIQDAYQEGYQKGLRVTVVKATRETD